MKLLFVRDNFFYIYASLPLIIFVDGIR